MFHPDPRPHGEIDPSDWRRWLVPQHWERFTADDHAVWDILYARQLALVAPRIVQPFRDGLERLDLGEGGIPELEALSDRLEPLTGWRLVSVAGIVPDAAFFAMLRDRRFPVGNFMDLLESEFPQWEFDAEWLPPHAACTRTPCYSRQERRGAGRRIHWLGS